MVQIGSLAKELPHASGTAKKKKKKKSNPYHIHFSVFTRTCMQCYMPLKSVIQEMASASKQEVPIFLSLTKK